MKFKPARAGALALALTSLPAYAANDAFSVNGAQLVATSPGNYLPATAAYFANGLFSASNPAYIQGSFSATLSGFAPTSAYAALTASTTSASVALPAGTTVVVYNYGATPAFVKLGASGVIASTANDVIQPGSAQAFTVGANTYLAGVTSSGSTSLNISGGSGLPTGWGGGSTAGGGSTNVSQFGGSSVQTGTGMSGAGVPRVTVSNDSFVNPVGAANIVSTQASIGASATLVVAARSGAPGAGRVAATFYNGGAVTVYLGPSGVTTTTGFALTPGATFTFSTTAAFYGVVASGTANLSVLETY